PALLDGVGNPLVGVDDALRRKDVERHRDQFSLQEPCDLFQLRRGAVGAPDRDCIDRDLPEQVPDLIGFHGDGLETAEIERHLHRLGRDALHMVERHGPGRRHRCPEGLELIAVRGYSREERDAVARQLSGMVAQRPEMCDAPVTGIGLHPDDQLRYTVLGKVQTIAGSLPDQCGGKGAGTSFPVGPGADDRVRVADCGRLRPCEVVAKAGLVQVVWRAGAFEADAEPLVGSDHGLLLLRKVLVHPHLLPAPAGHPDRVQHGRHHGFCVERVEPLEAVLPDRLVGRAAHLCAPDPDQLLRTEDLPQRDEELQHPLPGLALFSGKDPFVLRFELHPVHHVARENSSSRPSTIVASIPTLTFVPSSSWQGSRDDPLTPVITMMSRSPLTRVATAYSTSWGSQGSMSSSTTTTCLSEVWAANAAMIAFFASPCVLFLIWITAWR